MKKFFLGQPATHATGAWPGQIDHGTQDLEQLARGSSKTARGPITENNHISPFLRKVPEAVRNRFLLVSMIDIRTFHMASKVKVAKSDFIPFSVLAGNLLSVRSICFDISASSPSTV